jgi:HAD superfamily hydrolase (TIGR01458 family)
MTTREPLPIDALLIDIDGVLVVDWQALPGAVAAFDRLLDADVPLRLATNTTTRTRAAVADALVAAGFHVAVDDILTAPVATAAHLRREHPGARCFLLSSGDVIDDFDGIDVVTDPEDADVVVLGGAGLVFTHDQLNHAFNLLLGGAAFVAMHRNLYWRTGRGLELDTGAYVNALEAASGVSPVTIGKPSASFFQAGVDALGSTAGSTAMIGDDVDNDVLGAQAAGLVGVLVCTGKFRPEVLDAAASAPDHVVDDVVAAVDLVLANR